MINSGIFLFNLVLVGVSDKLGMRDIQKCGTHLYKTIHPAVFWQAELQCHYWVPPEGGAESRKGT